MWTFASLTTSSWSFHSNSFFPQDFPLIRSIQLPLLTSFTMLPSPCFTVEIIHFGRCPNVSFSAHTTLCTGQKLLFLPLEYTLSHISCVSLVVESLFLNPPFIKMIFVECTANSCPGETFSFLRCRSLQLFQTYKWFGCLWIKLSVFGLSILVDGLVLVGMLLYYTPFTFRWWLEQCSVGCLRLSILFYNVTLV